MLFLIVVLLKSRIVLKNYFQKCLILNVFIYQQNCLTQLKLKEKGKKIVVKEFEEALKRTIKHRQLKKSTSYQYLIRLELYKLIKHLMDEQEYHGFRIWW